MLYFVLFMLIKRINKKKILKCSPKPFYDLPLEKILDPRLMHVSHVIIQ